jgi:UDP-N-acetylglucosamine--N-acetylmuramyl-(pentapeptide) pyrophosphoryl-undecaprenol N-acetylglucosamine transferase
MRVILTGGGTGGHIYPAVAIGQAIKKQWPKTELLYVGTAHGLESRIIPTTGFSFITIDVEGLQRKISFQAVKAVWKALAGLFKADKIIRDFQPDLVIGTGGYVCLPVVWSAARQKIPALLHEQNALPGLTNRFLSSRVNGIMLTFQEAQNHLSPKAQKKARLTGLPIRQEIMRVNRAEGLAYFGFSPDKPTLLAVGGSRGARSINNAMLRVCRDFADKIQIIHITGAGGYDSFLKQLKFSGIDVGNCGNIIIRPYLHQMECALACADLCVARAGAAFLAEMTAKGIPGILIPYPYAAENHQEHNARSLVQKKAAVMILDSQLNGEVLGKEIQKILSDEKERILMSENSKNAGNPDAIEKIINVVRPFLNTP